MSNVAGKNEKVRVVGKSWVIRLPKSFTEENKLTNGTQVLLTFKNDEKVEAEILPPLQRKVSDAAAKILGKRRKVYEELNRLGDSWPCSF